MPPITRKEFAAKIKEKYPDYAGVDDSVLVEKMVAKYPEYREQISDYDTQKKNDSATIAKPSGTGSAPTPSKLPLQEGSFYDAVGGDPLKSTRSVENQQSAVNQEDNPTFHVKRPSGNSSDRFFTSNRQKLTSDNTGTGLSQSIARPETKAEIQQTQDIQAQHLVNTHEAINRTIKSKLGANANPESPEYKKEFDKIATQLSDGDVIVSYDKEGKPGLKRMVGLVEGAARGWRETVKGIDEATSFLNMDNKQRIEYANKQAEANPNPQYLGEENTAMGEVGSVLGGVGPFAAKGAAGGVAAAGLTALAPFTGGASLAGLPAVAAIGFTAHDMMALDAQKRVLEAYHYYKKNNPEMSDEEAMEKANSRYVAGAVEGAAKSVALDGLLRGSSLNKPLNQAGKNVISSALKNTAKSANKMGLQFGGLEAATQAEGNLEGVKASPSEVGETFVNHYMENVKVGGIIHGLMHEVPNLGKAVLKTAFFKSGGTVQDAATALKLNVDEGNIPEEKAAKIVEDLAGFEKALTQVQQPGMKPEVEASVAGLQQKINNLVEKKGGQENPEIDAEIAATNKQIDEIKKTENPAKVEVDEVTGKTYEEGAKEVVTPEGFKNRIHEGGIVLGEPKATSHVTEEGYTYRSVGEGELTAIGETGGVFAREGKQRGGNVNTKYWSRGDGKFFYKDNQNVIRVKNGAISEGEVVKAKDLEVWDKEKNEFIPFDEFNKKQPNATGDTSLGDKANEPLPTPKAATEKQGVEEVVLPSAESVGQGDATSKVTILNKENEKGKGDTGISVLDTHENPLLQGDLQSISLLRGEGNKGLRDMANELLSILKRYGAEAKPESFSRQDRQQWELLQRELQVGYKAATDRKYEDGKVVSSQGGNEKSLENSKGGGSKPEKIGEQVDKAENAGGGGAKELGISNRDNNIELQGEGNIKDGAGKGSGNESVTSLEATEKGDVAGGSSSDAKGGGNGRTGKEGEGSKVEQVKPKANDTVTLPPSIKGGMERKFVFENGEWKQDVGTQKTRVGEPLQKQAQEAFDKANNKVEAKVEVVKNEKTTETRGDKNHTTFDITKGGENKGSIAVNYREDLGGYQVESSKVDTPNEGIGTEAYKQLIGQLDKPLISDSSLTPSAKKLWQKLEKEGLAKFDEEKGKYVSTKTQPENEVPIEAKAAEPTKTEPNKNSQEASKGEATTKEEPKPKPKVSEPEPPKTPPTNPEPIEGEGKGGNTDKAILNRLLNADGTPNAAKEGFQKEGLNYRPSSQAEAAEIAKSVIDSEGMDNALLMAGAGKFKGDTNSLIYAESLNRLAKAETEAKTTQEKIEFAKRYAEVAIEYDNAARDKGQFISAVNYFYKKSPLGIKIVEETKRQEAFGEYAKSKDKSWKEFYDELVKEPEFEEIIKTEVREQLKKERAEARAKRKDKVHTVIDDAIKQFKNSGATYSTLVPPKVITTALEGIKKAYDAGEKVVEIVQNAIDYISKEIGTEWDSERFREEWEKQLGKIEGTRDKKELAADQREKILERFRKKLKGMNEEQKDKVVRGAFKKLVENGALEYEDFKQIIGDVLGYGKLTPEESKKLTELVNDINSVDEIGRKAREEDRTPEALKAYQEAKKKAEKSATELGQIVYSKPDVVNRLLSIMQLNTLGIPSLVNNPIFNVWNQATVRFPIGIQLTVLDQMLYGASKVTNKLFGTGVLLPENNVFKGQGAFWSKLGIGAKQSTEQLFSGLTNADYFQKEVRTSQIHPFTSAKELWEFAKGNKPLTNAQKIDKGLQATVGVPAEIVARALNIGDKPQRYAAEGAQAAVFAKNLGLEGVDYKYFMEFPKEEAYRKYKAMGLSDAVATKKAEQIQERIIKQGEESTFQQDNLLNDAINAAFKPFGVAGEVVKKFNMPFVKIPLNAFWSVFNLVNPEVALMQSAIYGVKAMKSKSPLDIQQSKKWLAHAATGMATMAAVGALAKKGVINPSNDDDVTKKERQGERTYEQQNTINMSKLAAYMRGDDPSKVKGGLDVDLKWLGNIGQVMNFQAKKIEDLTPEQKQHALDFSESFLQNLTPSALDLVQTGVFSNTSSLFTALGKGGAFMDSYLLNLINMGTNIVHPAMAAQLSRAQLPYYSKQKADSFYEEVKNNMLARSSFLRNLTGQAPKASVGAWGDKLDRPDNVLLKWFGMSKKNMDNFAQPIYEDYKRTGNTKFLPPVVMPMIDKQKLSVAETEKLEILVGKARKDLVAPYVNKMATLEGYDKKYNKLSDDQKIEALNILYEEGFKKGKEQFLSLPAYKKYIKAEKTDEQKDETKEKAKFRKSQK